jgi:membrane-associated phospholipid phosphatase
VSITLEILQAQGADLAHSVDALARIGMAVADGFIACWQAKFEYDRIRPVSYIKRVIDPKWEPMLITPPFPEYPSGHATQSGAAAEVLTAVFGDNFAFDDATHVDDNIPARHFASFKAAAEEAAASRLYGGIHFRAANENGLKQGACVGANVNLLKTLG